MANHVHCVGVQVHASQFPDRVREDLLHSVRARAISNKFHYDSVKQTQQWLALHQRYAPSRNDQACQKAYDRAFLAAASGLKSDPVHLTGLGCGGGRKDSRCLVLLRSQGHEVSYTACDSSVPMVLTARQSAVDKVHSLDCRPLVCDLSTSEDLGEVFSSLAPMNSQRLFTFFGMLPNFESGFVFPRLAAWTRPGDLLLLSANLAPGDDYAAGVQKILPQYANDPTSQWLMMLLHDLGVASGDGSVHWTVEAEPGNAELLRVAASYEFARQIVLAVGDERFAIASGDSVRLFFSNRYSTEQVISRLQSHNFAVLDQWPMTSQEEAIFLARRLPDQVS